MVELIQPRDKQDVAFIDGAAHTQVTYHELANRITEFSYLFKQPKTLVFLFIRPTLECIITYLTLLKQQHAVAVLDDSLHSELKQRLIEVYQPEFVIAEPKAAAPLAGYSTVSHSFSSKLQILKIQKRNQPLVLHPDLQLLLSTSGTTGSPKFIRLSRKNLVSNAAAIIDYLHITSAERALTTLSYSYSYGLSVLHSHLMAGASIVLTDQSVVQATFWQLASTYNCTSMAGVPYTYQLLDSLGIDKLLPASIKTLTQAGGRLDPKLVIKLHEIMSKRQGRFIPMYGQTEATARIAYLPPRFLPEKAGAIGLPIPGGKLQLFAGDQEVLVSDAEGELVYEGPNVMMGYASGPEDLALGDLMHGRLYTGDLGYRDSHGIYYLTGRLKRISKVYGQRINLDEVEAAAAPFGRLAAVSDDKTICLYFESAEADMDACITFLAQLFHLSPTTFECIKLEHLPLTVSGKIDYTQLRK